MLKFWKIWLWCYLFLWLVCPRGTHSLVASFCPRNSWRLSAWWLFYRYHPGMNLVTETLTWWSSFRGGLGSAEWLAGWATEVGPLTSIMTNWQDPMNTKEGNPEEVLWISMGLLALRNSDCLSTILGLKFWVLNLVIIRLMENILHHLGCPKCFLYPSFKNFAGCRIFSINSIICL